MASISTAELKAELGISRKTITRWVKAGCPHTKQGRAFRFGLAEVKAWMAEVGRSGRRGGDTTLGLGPEDSTSSSSSPSKPPSLREQLLEARVRTTVAQAQARELQLDVERGKLLVAAEVEEGRLARIAHARAVLIGGPPRLAPELVGLTAEEAERRLKDWVHSALSELAGQ